MSAVGVRRAAPPHRRTTTGPAWLLYVTFPMIPIWWILGLSGLIVPTMAVAAFAGLLMRGWLKAPRAFLLWVLFLLWVVVAMTQVPDAARGFAAGYRLMNYTASAIFFLYVFNAPREDLSAQTVVKAMAIFWVVVVAGGVLGMVAPAVSVVTPLGRLLPSSLLEQEFVSDLVTASTSAERAFAGLGFHRPKAPFAYTNQWGAVYAATLPFAIGAVRLVRTPRWRFLLICTLLGSIVPLVFSLDRGAWLSATLCLAYAGFRMLTSGQRRGSRLMVLGVGVIAVSILLVATPLKDVVLVRLDRGYGDEDRTYLYSESIRLASESPWVGYGAPVDIEGLPSIGTHGHLWTVLVSFGVVGLVLFLAWFGATFIATMRRLPWLDEETEHARMWCHIAIFTTLVQLPYYELLPWGLPAIMIAAAVGWRERLTPWLTDPPLRPHDSRYRRSHSA